MTINKKKSKKKAIEEVFLHLFQDYDIETIEHVALDMLNLSNSSKNPKEKLQLSFEQAVAKFYESDKFQRGLTELTQESYKTELKLLENYVDNNAVGGKGAAFSDIIYPTKFLVDYLKQTNTLSTKNKKTAVLRTFIKTILRDFYEENKEDFDVSFPINWENNSLPKGFSLEQIQELLILSKKTPFGLRNYTILCVFLGMGIRVGELVGITIDDIDLKGFVTVKPKRRKHKPVATPIHDNALKILMSYISFTYGHLAETWEDLKKMHGEKHVFSSNEGKNHLTIRAVELMVKKIVKQAKSISQEDAEKFSCHNFRHSFAQFALRSGINIAALAKILNHQGLATVMVYANQTKEQLKEDMDKHVLGDFQLDYLKKGGYKVE